MILDATASNRRMYETKNYQHIIYIDLQRRLEIKPTIFADNTTTPFLSSTFDTILYDPPHMWGDKSSYFVFPDKKSFLKKWQGYGDIPRYYGGDIYKSKTQLLKHIYCAQKEFNRILKLDGLLWLKWCEVHIPLRKILSIFREWIVILEIPQATPSRVAGKYKTWWVCLAKKGGKRRQSTFS